MALGGSSSKRPRPWASVIRPARSSVLRQKRLFKSSVAQTLLHCGAAGSLTPPPEQEGESPPGPRRAVLVWPGSSGALDNLSNSLALDLHPPGLSAMSGNLAAAHWHTQSPAVQPAGMFSRAYLLLFRPNLITLHFGELKCCPWGGLRGRPAFLQPAGHMKMYPLLIT